MPELFECTLHTQIYILHTHLYINMCNKEMEIFHFFIRNKVLWWHSTICPSENWSHMKNYLRWYLIVRF